MKRLNVSIDDDLHRQLKMAVAGRGTTIGQFVIEAITEKIDSDEMQNQIMMNKRVDAYSNQVRRIEQ